jgi:hypothetical protein
VSRGGTFNVRTDLCFFPFATAGGRHLAILQCVSDALLHVAAWSATIEIPKIGLTTANEAGLVSLSTTN